MEQGAWGKVQGAGGQGARSVEQGAWAWSMEHGAWGKEQGVKNIKEEVR